MFVHAVDHGRERGMSIARGDPHPVPFVGRHSSWTWTSAARRGSRAQASNRASSLRCSSPTVLASSRSRRSDCSRSCCSSWAKFSAASTATRSTAAMRLAPRTSRIRASRSEEHTSELQSLMRPSYAGFCLKKKTEHKPANSAVWEHTKQGTKKDTTTVEVQTLNLIHIIYKRKVLLYRCITGASARRGPVSTKVTTLCHSTISTKHKL